MRRACRYLPVNTDTRPTQPNAPNGHRRVTPDSGRRPLARDRDRARGRPAGGGGVRHPRYLAEGRPETAAPTFAYSFQPGDVGRRKGKLETGVRRRRPPLAVTHPPASHPVRAQPRLERVTRRVLQHGHGDGRRRRRDPMILPPSPIPVRLVAGEPVRRVGLVPEPQLAVLHDVQGLDDPGRTRRFVDDRVAHHRPARRRVRRGEHLAVLREPRPRRYLASIGCAIPGVRRRERGAAQGDVAAAAGPAGGSGDVRRPVERGVAPGGRGGRRRLRLRLVSRGSGVRAVPSRRGRVRRAGAGWARGRAAEREGVGRGCGGRDAVGGVVPGGRARGSAGRVHRSTPAARSPLSTAPFPNATTTVTRVEPGRAWPGMR